MGRLVQETGDEGAALWCTRRAVDLAAAGGDQALAGYAPVRRALVTRYREDAEQTIALTRRAQSGVLPSRIRGLAAQREAQVMPSPVMPAPVSVPWTRLALCSPAGTTVPTIR